MPNEDTINVDGGSGGKDSGIHWGAAVMEAVTGLIHPVQTFQVRRRRRNLLHTVYPLLLAFMMVCGVLLYLPKRRFRKLCKLH